MKLRKTKSKVSAAAKPSRRKSLPAEVSVKKARKVVLPSFSPLASRLSSWVSRLSSFPRVSLPKLKEKWRRLESRYQMSGRIQNEITAIRKVFKKKLEKFLVINFDPTMAEMIYVESLPGRLRLLAYDTQDIRDKEGKREEILTEFINRFLKNHAVADKDVIVSISNADSIFVKDFVLPVMPEEEILKAAKWQLKDDVLFDLEKASIDWRVLGEFVNEQGEKGNRTVFIAADDEVIHQYLALVQGCQLDPLSVTSGSFNYTHILENLPENPRVAAILDVGHTESTFGIYADNKLNFVRRLPISWEKLMQSLTKVLISDSGVTQFTYDQAEEITKTVGIPEDGVKMVKDNIHASHVMSLMRPLLEALTREIKFSLDYFTSNFEKDRPTRLYLTGDSSNLKNLDRYLGKEFRMDVAYLSLPACVDTAGLPQIKAEDQNKIINTVGAALGGLRAINLLPFEVKTQKLEVVEKAFLRLVSVIAGVVFLFSVMLMQFQINNYQGRIRSAKLHLQTMAGAQALAKRVKEKEDLIRALEGRRVPVEGVLKAVSAVIPPEVVLDSLEFDPGGHRLVLKGAVSTDKEIAEAALADFLRGLDASVFFTDATFVSSQKTGSDYKFEIKCDVYQ